MLAAGIFVQAEILESIDELGKRPAERHPPMTKDNMLLVFACESCGKRFQVDERFQGKRGRCSHCGHLMRIPHTAAEAHAVPAVAPAAAPETAAAAPGGFRSSSVRPSTGRWSAPRNRNFPLSPLARGRSSRTIRCSAWRLPCRPPTSVRASSTYGSS